MELKGCAALVTGGSGASASASVTRSRVTASTSP